MFDKETHSPLHLAIQEDHSEAALMLLEAGISVNSTDKFGLSALNYSCSMANVPLSIVLVNSGANVNISDREAGTTPLMFAAQEESVEFVSLLLSKGADINAIDSNGQSALFHAAARKLTEVYEYLIQHGADESIVDLDDKVAKYYFEFEVD